MAHECYHATNTPGNEKDNWTLTNGSMILYSKRRFPQVSG
jgi:hypothetical protein